MPPKRGEIIMEQKVISEQFDFETSMVDNALERLEYDPKDLTLDEKEEILDWCISWIAEKWYDLLFDTIVEEVESVMEHKNGRKES